MPLPTATTARGFIAEINDAKYNSNGDRRSSDATFAYDDLGRLTAVGSGRPGVAESFTYDALGNMKTYHGVTYTYAAAKPHQVSRVGTTELDYTDNGTLQLGRGGQGYAYDAEDRLTGATVSGAAVSFAYDHAGAKVRQEAGGTETRYYGDLVEVTGSEMTKVYFFGGRRVASNRVAAPAALAGVVEPAVEVAGDPGGQRLLLIVTLRPDVQLALVAAVLLGTAGLLAWPGRRRARVVGVRLRAGTVVLVLLATGAGTVPVPWVVPPAWAGGGGPPPCLAGELQHYHADHLGSVQVLTGFHGEAVEHLRYRAYGSIRHRSTASEASLTWHRFTEYELEPTTGLYDAGARFYDPQLAIFLTHDPARQFASPYTYTNWNPVNLTDPSGACVWDLGISCTTLALVFVGAFAVASAIDTGVRTGSVGAAFQAGAIAGAVGLVGVGLGVVVGPTVATASLGTQVALATAAVGAAGYGTYQAAANGYYATAVVGALATVVAAYGLAEVAQGGNEAGSGLSQQEQMDFAEINYGQRFGRGSSEGLVAGGGAPPAYPNPGDIVDEQLRIQQGQASAQRLLDIAATESAAAREVPLGMRVPAARLFSGGRPNPRFEGLYAPYTEGFPINFSRNVLIGRQLSHVEVVQIRGVRVPGQIPGIPAAPLLPGPTVYLPPHNGVVMPLRFPAP